jgi:hypothetical protein
MLTQPLSRNKTRPRYGPKTHQHQPPVSSQSTSHLGSPAQTVQIALLKSPFFNTDTTIPRIRYILKTYYSVEPLHHVVGEDQHKDDISSIYQSFEICDYGETKRWNTRIFEPGERLRGTDCLHLLSGGWTWNICFLGTCITCWV